MWKVTMPLELIILEWKSITIYCRYIIYCTVHWVNLCMIYVLGFLSYCVYIYIYIHIYIYIRTYISCREAKTCNCRSFKGGNISFLIFCTGPDKTNVVAIVHWCTRNCILHSILIVYTSVKRIYHFYREIVSVYMLYIFFFL